MSGGEALANCLAESLQYPILGREVAVEAASKLGVPEETLARKFERSPSLWGRLTGDRKVYVSAVQASLAEAAAGGDLVYHGYAGHMLLKEVPNVLRVRLIAPLEARVNAVMERHQLNRDESLEYIRNVDEDRIRWTKLIYGVDWSDPSLYDMVLSLETMTIATACQIVLHAVRQPEYATTDEIRQKIRDFHLACQARVALMSNAQTRGLDLEVTASGGGIEVTGQVPAAEMLTHTSRRTEEEILRTIQTVEGVQKVHLDVHRFDAYH